jgi:O-antigen/teichoic acid export membrane protein
MLRSIYNWARGLFYRVFETELIRRIVKNSSYLISATGLSMVLSMVQSIFMFRMLGPEQVGFFATVRTFTNSLNRFASFRINEMVVRYVRFYEEAGEKDKAAVVFKVAGLLEIGGALLAFILIKLLSPLGAEYIAHSPDMVDWFVIYGLVVLVNMLYESSSGLLQVFDRFQTLAVITAVQNASTLVLIFLAYLRGGGLAQVVQVYILGKVVGALGVTGFAVFTAGRRWGGKWWRTPLSVLGEHRRSLLTFAFSTNLSSTVSLVAKDSEALWVPAFLGNIQMGYYETALKLIALLQLPLSPLPTTTYPELSREITRRDWGNVKYLLRRGSLLSAVYSLPVTIGLVVFGNWVITTMYGADFLPSYPALVILLVGYTFVNIFYWNRVALLALNRPVFPTVVNFIGMVIKVGIITLLAVAGIFRAQPSWGYLVFAGLLSGYYLFTVGLAAVRIILDLRSRSAPENET